MGTVLRDRGLTRTHASFNRAVALRSWVLVPAIRHELHATARFARPNLADSAGCRPFAAQSGFNHRLPVAPLVALANTACVRELDGSARRLQAACSPGTASLDARPATLFFT